ncbi:hypothetical protein LLH00_05850 [bacterium]|nr:hypothetical protein [bacterium]
MKETPVTPINTGRRCSQCGEEGNMVNGVCQTCQYKAKFGQAALANWPDENVKFMAAPEVEALAKDIFSLCKEMEWRREARIYYQFQHEMSGDKMASCYRIMPRLQDLIRYDFVITVDWTRWKLLDIVHRQREVYHQLCHIGKNDNLVWCLERHEFEGFVAEWTRFHDVIKEDAHLGRIFKQQELDLFKPQAVEDLLPEAELAGVR